VALRARIEDRKSKIASGVLKNISISASGLAKRAKGSKKGKKGKKGKKSICLSCPSCLFCFLSCYGAKLFARPVAEAEIFWKFSVSPGKLLMSADG
jgi:hypothetical protein